MITKMVNAIPRWIIVQYSRLWKEKNSETFTLEESEKILKQSKAVAAVVLSHLRKTGLLNVEFDPRDSRKRIYSLKNPEQVILEVEKDE